MIDWKSPTDKISKYFTVKEALYLPAWEVFHNPTDVEKQNILAVAEKMDAIRDYLDRPIIVHCWIRPTCADAKGTKWDRRNYNSYVGGAPGSAHQEGKAVDWHPSSMTCGDARAILEPKLTELQVRMENNEGNWVHIDTRQPLPKKSRFFRP